MRPQTSFNGVFFHFGNVAFVVVLQS